MAPACWLSGSVVGGLRKGTMASVHFDARYFRFFLYIIGSFQATTLVLELRGSATE